MALRTDGQSAQRLDQAKFQIEAVAKKTFLYKIRKGSAAIAHRGPRGRGSFGNVIRLLLLSGARRGEIAKVTRDQILADRLVLPPLSAKTGERHEVPLTQIRPRRAAGDPEQARISFGENRGCHVRLGQGSRGSTARLGRRLHPARPAPHLPHADVRLGVEPEIAAVGHKRTGLERLYNFDQARQLGDEAFAKASDHIARLLSLAAKEGKVVAIQART